MTHGQEGATGPASNESVEAVPPRKSLERAAYLEHRQRMVDGKQRAQQRLDQLVVGGASGALVLSVTFLEKIAATPSASTRYLLAAGWTLLLGSLLAALISHYTSATAFEQAMTDLDWQYDGHQPTAGASVATRATGVLNVFTIILFVLGMTALVRFAYVNVQFKETVPDVRAVQQPSVPAVSTPGSVTSQNGNSRRNSSGTAQASKVSPQRP